MKSDSVAEINPIYRMDHRVELILRGSFTQQSQAVMREDLLFTFDAELLQQTFRGGQPQVRVLLDNYILLEPVSISPQEWRLALNTRAIPDLFLMGLHTLTVIVGEKVATAQIRFGLPLDEDWETPLSVRPVVDEVTVVSLSDQPYVRLTGKHFMLNPAWARLEINGVVYPIQQTNILRGDAWETFAYLPSDVVLLPETDYFLTYTTPHGVASKNFRYE
jgi:hypothetical protein